jgi:catecholate siderophore receptor
MNQPFDDFSLRLRHFYAPAPEAIEETADAATELSQPLPSGPAAYLRPDPSVIFRGASVAAATVGSLFAFDAQAQTTTTTEATTLDTVVVQGQQNSPYVARTISRPLYTEPLRDTPQSIQVVPQAVIQQQNATSLREVLRNVPGISFQAGEGGGGPGGDFLSIRGFNARNDVFIDGIRDFGGYSRDPFNFEQVEVIKGPSSSTSGRGSTGGSINLVSKVAQLESSFYRADLGVGTEEYKRFTIDVNQRLTGLWKNRGAAGDTGFSKDGKAEVPPAPVEQDPYFKASIRLNAMWTDGDVANRDFVEYERWGIAPSLTLGFGDNTKVILSYFHMTQDNVPDYGIPWVPSGQVVLPKRYWNRPAPVRYSNWYGLIERDFEDIVTDLGTLQFEQKAGDWFVLNNTTRYGETRRNSVTTAPRFVATETDPDIALNRQFISRDQTDTIIANQFTTRFTFDTWSVKHDLVTGLDLSYETAKNKIRTEVPAAPRASLYNPNANADYDSTIAYNGAENKSTTKNAGLFLGETMKFWEERIQLSGTVRWDYFESELEQFAAPAVAGGPRSTTEFERVDKVWSYRVALAVKPAKIGTVYFAYGTSFNPSAEGAVSQNLLTEATASLEPEENETFEIGTKWDLFNEKLSVTAAVFRINKTNARTPGLSPNDPPTVLEGEQRVDGFEIGVAGNITEKWKVYGGYTYLDSEVRSSNTFTTDPETGELKSQVGNELPQVPDHSFSLWSTYSLPWDIEVGGGAFYVGRRYSSTDNLREAEGYWTFDAMISKQFGKHVKAQINVYNLGDEEYIDRVGGGHFVPGAGRTAMLTVGLQW